MLTCVNQIGINEMILRERTKSEDTILGLKGDVHTRDKEISAEGGNADTEIHIHAIFNFKGSALSKAVSLLVILTWLASGRCST